MLCSESASWLNRVVQLTLRCSAARSAPRYERIYLSCTLLFRCFPRPSLLLRLGRVAFVHTDGGALALMGRALPLHQGTISLDYTSGPYIRIYTYTTTLRVIRRLGEGVKGARTS